MVTWNLDCTQLTTAVFENFLQRKKNVWIKRSSLKIKRVLQPPKNEILVFLGRPRHKTASWSFLAHYANMSFRPKSDHTVGAECSFATHSFNDMEHQSSSTATRVEKSALTLAVENGLWRLSLC